MKWLALWILSADNLTSEMVSIVDTVKWLALWILSADNLTSEMVSIVDTVC